MEILSLCCLSFAVKMTTRPSYCGRISRGATCRTCSTLVLVMPAYKLIITAIAASHKRKSSLVICTPECMSVGD